jgi:hypothetical protein
MRTPPEYTHSPSQNKRRRLTIEEDAESGRPSQIPRLYASPSRVLSRHQSPREAPRPAADVWAPTARPSPPFQSSALPSMRSPRAVEFRERMEPRLSLPSLPRLDFERNPAHIQRVASLPHNEYIPESMRPTAPLEAPAPIYRQPTYDYGYHHPTRVQSLSLGSVHPFDKAPFASAAYGHHFQDTYMRIGELGMGMGGDNKQRKRRGNLPKETTDKLRAWFVAHLHHPYPTEDEKQDLMRQTGLQMSKLQPR